MTHAEVVHPKLLEYGTGDRVHRFKQQQKTTAENNIFTVLVNFYVLPLDFLLCLKITFSIS